MGAWARRRWDLDRADGQGGAEIVEQIPDLPENVIGLTAKGKVTAEDYASTIVPAVEERFSRHPKIRFLYHLGDVEWIRGAIRIFGLAMPGDVRVFHNRDIAEARRWLCE